MTEPIQLKQEIKTYNKLKKQLLAEAKGQFVLIKDDKLLGTYQNYNDALSEGYKRFGNKPFLIKQITEVEEVNYFTRLILQ